ncbi:MAG: O-antigen ligase family protein [Gemmataceae bacterium]|nr:O-antigen ligase family protein [Gemmataceae bacterium]MCI0739341.1 O-antigen ligase family protein [Gemmataceae bacterium]
MQFFVFILVNAALFIRPGELLAELSGVQLYLYLILTCLVLSMPVVLNQFTRRFPGVPPIVGCALALFPAILLSHVSHGRIETAVFDGFEFFKVLVYFLLLVGLVDTTARLRRFVFWTGVFSGLLALLTVIQYHRTMAAPVPVPDESADVRKEKKAHGYAVKERVWDPDQRRSVDLYRMCGTGIFNDPNDLALAFVTAIPICLYWFTDRRLGLARGLWLLLACFFVYAMMLTHSRGGLLALMAGLGALFHARFRTRRTVWLGAITLPILLVLFGGRMTNFVTDEGTGQGRIQLWSDGLDLFRESPLFGIGMENYRLRSRLVAHNSFIHSYAELGMLGGTFFLGAFFFAIVGMLKARASVDPTLRVGSSDDPELDRLQPFLTSMLVAYAAGILFLSRTYVVPTYMMLGLATVFLRLKTAAEPVHWMPSVRFPLLRLAGVSMAFLLAAYVFVRVMVRWS